ncbi:hypothetical protein PBOI14_49220 [Pseudomonas sp. Boi14]|nr:hypothetical protein PBOI14_49220 [Pseudomonas sp. Boi14]
METEILSDEELADLTGYKLRGGNVAGSLIVAGLLSRAVAVAPWLGVSTFA